MFGISPLPRRSFLQLGAAGLIEMALHRIGMAQDATAGVLPIDEEVHPTQFQIACMTLPYHRFPLERALQGIRAAGFDFIAWGTTHRETETSPDAPLMPKNAPPARAKELGDRCRDLGLTPLMMFSEIYPEAPDAMAVLTNRIQQAAAAGIPQVLTFGHTDGAHRKLWVERFRKLGPLARDHGVTIVVKQHGETGKVTGEIVREVADDGVLVNYDAGNVMDYTKGIVDPLEDVKSCAELIRSFCIKDHRLFPANEDCGPGLGEIDHYRLLHTVAATGRSMPLCCENISAPRIQVTKPEEMDALARRAREFLGLVVRGIHASPEISAAK